MVSNIKRNFICLIFSVGLIMTQITIAWLDDSLCWLHACDPPQHLFDIISCAFQSLLCFVYKKPANKLDNYIITAQEVMSHKIILQRSLKFVLS